MVRDGVETVDPVYLLVLVLLFIVVVELPTIFSQYTLVAPGEPETRHSNVLD